MNLAFSNEQLKEAVEQVFGRKIEYHKDCDELSDVIFKKLNTRLSTSTLKRFFNLVSSASSPSKFTINTLKEWESSASTTEKPKESLQVSDNFNSQKYIGFAEEQSEITYNLTKARVATSEIDWVLRTTDLDFLNDFIDSDKSVYSIVAPPGWGKTVFMLQAWQLVQKLYPANLKWFFTGSLIKSNKLFSKNEEELLQILSDYSHTSQIEGPVFLFVDALDEIASNLKEIHEFIHRLLSSLSPLIQAGKIKIVLSLRVNIEPLLNNELNIFQEKVYSKQVYEQSDQHFGIRAFSDKEVDEWLIQKNLPNLQKLKQQINFSDKQLSEIYIPSLLAQVKWHFDVGLTITPLTNLRSAAFRYLIEAHPFSSAMLVVLNEFLTKIGFGLDGASVPVRQFLPIIRDHALGYQQLLKENIFVEEIVENKFKLPLRNVRFFHQSYQNYFIAYELYQRYKPLDERFVIWYSSKYSENTHFNEILSFIIDLAIEDEQYEIIELVYCKIIQHRITYGMPIPANDIFYQLGYMIRVLPDLQRYLERCITSTEWGHQYFVELFVDLDYLTGYYGHFLKSSLSSISNVNGGNLFVSSLLLYKAIQELNEAGMNTALPLVEKQSRFATHLYPKARALAYRALIGFVRDGAFSKMLLADIKIFITELETNDKKQVSSYVAISLLLEGLFFTPYFSEISSSLENLLLNLNSNINELTGSTSFYKSYFLWILELHKEMSSNELIWNDDSDKKYDAFLSHVSELRYPYKNWTLLVVYKMSITAAISKSAYTKAKQWTEAALKLANELNFSFDSLVLQLDLWEINHELGEISHGEMQQKRGIIESDLTKNGFKNVTSFKIKSA